MNLGIGRFLHMNQAAHVRTLKKGLKPMRAFVLSFLDCTSVSV